MKKVLITTAIITVIVAGIVLSNLPKEDTQPINNTEVLSVVETEPTIKDTPKDIVKKEVKTNVTVKEDVQEEQVITEQTEVVYNPIKEATLLVKDKLIQNRVTEVLDIDQFIKLTHESNPDLFSEDTVIESSEKCAEYINTIIKNPMSVRTPTICIN